MALNLACRACGRVNEVVLPVRRKDECEGCGAELRSCVNCVSYEPSRANDCREPLVEPVREKDRANMCEFYRPAPGPAPKTASRDELRAAAEALFRKK